MACRSFLAARKAWRHPFNKSLEPTGELVIYRMGCEPGLANAMLAVALYCFLVSRSLHRSSMHTEMFYGGTVRQPMTTCQAKHPFLRARRHLTTEAFLCARHKTCRHGKRAVGMSRTGAVHIAAPCRSWDTSSTPSQFQHMKLPQLPHAGKQSACCCFPHRSGFPCGCGSLRSPLTCVCLLLRPCAG